MGDRLATIDMGRKVGAGVPLSGGGAGSSSNNVAWTEAYLRTKWNPDPSSHLATIDMGCIYTDAGFRRQSRGCYALSVGGAGSLSNTIWPSLRATSIPSDILIHPTVWSQYTNVTDRQDRTDGQRSDSKGRTVLQTVAKTQKI